MQIQKLFCTFALAFDKQRYQKPIDGIKRTVVSTLRLRKRAFSSGGCLRANNEAMTQPTANTILHLNELEQGKHHYDFHLGSAYFEAQEKSEITGGDVDVEADLTLYESDYSLHLKAKGEVKLICDRCLGEMSYAVDAEDEIQPDSEDTQTDTIDLGWLAYETITINLPLVHSHPDGECMQDMQQLLQTHLCSAVEDNPEQ